VVSASVAIGLNALAQQVTQARLWSGTTRGGRRFYL